MDKTEKYITSEQMRLSDMRYKLWKERQAAEWDWKVMSAVALVPAIIMMWLLAEYYYMPRFLSMTNFFWSMTISYFAVAGYCDWKCRKIQPKLDRAINDFDVLEKVLQVHRGK